MQDGEPYWTVFYLPSSGSLSLGRLGGLDARAGSVCCSIVAYQESQEMMCGDDVGRVGKRTSAECSITDYQALHLSPVGLWTLACLAGDFQILEVS